jgi:RimJ/RimL family protein N-acetyltransferase
MTEPSPPTLAPVLETPRLRLRSHALRDLPECVAMWSDPAVARFTIGAPSPPPRTWSRLTAYVGHWALLGFGYWAVESKDTRRYIGELGFADFKRDVEPSIAGLPELGWALATHAHRQGFATEALRAVVAWGDEHLAAARTVCLINPENAASLRVAEKLGYTQAGETVLDGVRDLIFERHRG